MSHRQSGRAKLDLSIDRNKVSHSFERIAKELFSNYTLRANNEEYHFTEIEFYYYSKPGHLDKSVHPHDWDEHSWRFHYSGLDLTFKGNKDTEYGGILIRGIKWVNTSNGKLELLNGSLRVQIKILENARDGHLKLKLNFKRRNAEELKIYKVFRQGLSPQPYADSHYRYFTDLNPKDFKKTDLDLINHKKVLVH